MANRITIHQEIKDLCKKLKDTNKFLSESNDISLLDIDLLRKTSIEIYDRINQLRLVMSEKVEELKKTEPPVQPKTSEVKKPEVKVDETPAEPKKEEVKKSEPEVKEEPQAETIIPEKEELKESKVEEKPTPIEDEAPKEEPKPKPQLVMEDQEEEEEDEPQDLASRFGSSPIKDLKREISIAKKFEFINSLFHGNMEVYAHSIHQMNGADSGDAAFGLLNELREEFGWEEEDKNYMELANLIRRRYLN